MKLNRIALILMTSYCTYIGVVSASTSLASATPTAKQEATNNKSKDCKTSLFSSCELVDKAVAAVNKTNADGTTTRIDAKPAMYSKQPAYPELFDIEGNSLVDSVDQVQKSTAAAIKNTLNTSDTNTNKLATTTSDIKKQKIDIVRNTYSIEDNTADINNNKEAMGKNKSDLRKVERNVQLLEKRISDFDDKIKRGFATQSALNGLFQPYRVGKFNLTAALGGYEATTAIALGTGYRFDEMVAVKAGLSTNVGGFDEVAYNVGMNIEW